MISIKLNRKNPGGLKGFSKRLEALAGKEVAVGFPRGGSGLGNPHYKNGASILLVAVANNYGLGVPAPGVHGIGGGKNPQVVPRVHAHGHAGRGSGNTDIHDVLKPPGASAARLPIES